MTLCDDVRREINLNGFVRNEIRDEDFNEYQYTVSVKRVKFSQKYAHTEVAQHGGNIIWP